jgi:hypothetical protein
VLLLAVTLVELTSLDVTLVTAVIEVADEVIGAPPTPVEVTEVADWMLVAIDVLPPTPSGEPVVTDVLPTEAPPVPLTEAPVDVLEELLAKAELVVSSSARPPQPSAAEQPKKTRNRRSVNIETSSGAANDAPA